MGCRFHSHSLDHWVSNTIPDDDSRMSTDIPDEYGHYRTQKRTSNSDHEAMPM